MSWRSTQPVTTALAAQGRAGWWFISPWLIGLLALYVYPFAASFYWSFCQYDLLTAPEVVGTENYRQLSVQLIDGGDFRQALCNTLYFALVAVPATVLVGITMDGQWRVRDIAAFREEQLRQGETPDDFTVIPLPTPRGGNADAGWLNGNYFLIPHGSRQAEGDGGSSSSGSGRMGFARRPHAPAPPGDGSR